MQLIKNGDLVDFDVPICMNKEQRSKFIKFMKNKFGENNVKVSEILEMDKEFPNVSPGKRWQTKDYYNLITGKFNQLNREEMSIKMKMATFRPKFLAWLKESGHNKISFEIVKEFVETFIERGKT